MKFLNTFLFLLLAISLGCQKPPPDEPANANNNHQGLDCGTCPSYFHPFEDLPMVTEEYCDDFSNAADYPEAFITAPGVIGYTQEGSSPITLLAGGFVQINGATPGFYGVNSLIFNFDATEQQVDFIVYGAESAFAEMGFEVNGSPFINYTSSFPIAYETVSIEVDFDLPDISDLSAFRVRFTGQIETITLTSFESGLQSLCVTKSTFQEPSFIDKTASIYFDDFFNYNGEVVGYHPTHKTPLGYYRITATNLVINFDEFLVYTPTEIGFVHAYPAESSPLINVRLPSTPLIVTSPDSLEYYLSPYGYKTEHYFSTGGKLWTNLTDPHLLNQVVDSIIIKGNGMNNIKIGANLQSSNIRRVCT